MRTRPSLQRKGPERETSPLQVPNRRLSLLSKIDLGSCYLFVPCNRLLSLYVQAAKHKDSDIIGVCGYLCCKRASKRDTAQGRTCLLIPKPTERRLQSENIEKRRQGQPCQTYRSIVNASERFLFTCTTVCMLWYIMLIHLRSNS